MRAAQQAAERSKCCLAAMHAVARTLITALNWFESFFSVSFPSGRQLASRRSFVHVCSGGNLPRTPSLTSARHACGVVNSGTNAGTNARASWSSAGSTGGGGGAGNGSGPGAGAGSSSGAGAPACVGRDCAV